MLLAGIIEAAIDIPMRMRNLKKGEFISYEDASKAPRKTITNPAVYPRPDPSPSRLVGGGGWIFRIVDPDYAIESLEFKVAATIQPFFGSKESLIAILSAKESAKPYLNVSEKSELNLHDYIKSLHGTALESALKDRIRLEEERISNIEVKLNLIDAILSGKLELPDDVDSEFVMADLVAAKDLYLSTVQNHKKATELAKHALTEPR